MILEHGIYTAALAIIIAMFYEQYTKNNPVLVAGIIWFAVFIPDTDYIISVVIDATTNLHLIEHGSFHNILALGLATVIFGFLITKTKKYRSSITLTAAMSCVGIGFLSHLAEDALVYKSAYPFLAPFSSTIWQTGWIMYPKDLSVYGIMIGSKNVYAFGLMLVAGAILTRYTIQGTDWLIPYSDKFRFKKLCSMLGIINEEKVN